MITTMSMGRVGARVQGSILAGLLVTGCSEAEVDEALLDDGIGDVESEAKTTQDDVEQPDAPMDVEEPNDGAGRVSLVWAEGWREGRDEDDPLGSHRPAVVSCLPPQIEDGMLEIDTALCNYSVLVQPTMVGLRAGDEVEVVVIHDPLLADHPAEAHIAVAIGEDIAWEVEVAIPSDYGHLKARWVVPESLPAGTPVVMHLHNHGYNNYRLVAVERLRA